MRSQLLFGVVWDFRLIVIGRFVEIFGVNILVVHSQDATAVAIGTWKWEEVNAVMIVAGLDFLILPGLASITLECGCAYLDRITPFVHYIRGVTLRYYDGIGRTGRNALKPDGCSGWCTRGSRTTATAAS